MGASIEINRSKTPIPKIYGIYTRNGRRRIRFYRHELKNGKGLDFYDVLNFRINEVQEEMRKALFNAAYI